MKKSIALNILLVISLLLGGCNSLASVTTDTPTATLAPAATTTPIPTLALPVVQGTAFPRPLQPLSPDNAEQMISLARWGRGNIDELAYSSDGKWLAVGTSIGTYLYDSKKLSPAGFFESKSPVISLAFSTDAKLLATGTAMGGVKTWNIESGNLVTEISIESDSEDVAVYSLGFSEDDLRLYIGGLGVIDVWDIQEEKFIDHYYSNEEMWLTGNISPVGISNDGQVGALLVYYADSSAGVVVLQLSEGNDLCDIPIQVSASGVALSSDGGMVAAALDDMSIQIWNVSDCSLQATFWSTDFSANKLLFSSDGNSLAAAGSNSNMTEIWSIADGEVIYTFDGGSLAFAPDGKSLMTGTKDGSLKIWNLSDGSLLNSVSDFSSSTMNFAYSSDGKIFANSTSQGINLWNSSDGRILETIPYDESSISALAFSPDSQMVVTGDWKKKINIWNPADGTLLRTVEGHSSYITNLTFSADGQLIASGSYDGTIKLWQKSDGKLVKTLSPQAGMITDLGFSPNGSYLTSISIAVFTIQSKIQIWNVSDGSRVNLGIEDDRSIESFTFSPDSQLIALGGRKPGALKNSSIEIWKISENQTVLTLDIPDGIPTSIAFSPDGKLIVAGTYYGKILVWDATSGELLKTLEDHSDTVNELMFSPDGKMLYSYSSDGTVRIWGIPPQ